jgi:hypothetical protein
MTSSPPYCLSRSGSLVPQHPDTLSTRAELTRWAGRRIIAALPEQVPRNLLPHPWVRNGHTPRSFV